MLHIHAERPCFCPCSCRKSQVCVRVRVRVCVRVRVRVRVYKCRTVRHPNKKTNDAGTVPVPDQARQYGIFSVRYRTEKLLMPALVFWMPMRSYAEMMVFLACMCHICL
jgi:hypothetical protein